MKRLIALLLCAALIFSLGCSRSLPTKEEKETKAQSSSSAEEKPVHKETKTEKAKDKKTEDKKTEEKAESSSAAEAPKEEKPAVKAEEKSPAPVVSEPASAAPSNSENASFSGERDWRLMLVKPDNLIPEDYKPDLTMTKYGYEVDSRIVEDVTALIDGAKKDNVSLIICYGYRTLAQSQQLFEKQLKKQLSYGLSQEAALAEAKRWVAPPGTSDHHTGLALDIVTPEYQVLNHGFFNTPAGQWMHENSWKYGFVIRFPEDKQEITGITYEPWHLRFVGKEHAAAMHEKNLCLEEYVAEVYG